MIERVLPSRALLQVWWRQARGQGGLGLLLAALTLAVLATTLLTQSIGQIQVAARQQAGQLLGGDLLLNSSQPLDPRFSEQAQQAGLRQTPVVSFTSMLQAGDPNDINQMRFQLVNVKAVTSGYPLRGQLTVSSTTGTLPPGQAPQPGQIWLEPSLFDTLQVQIGQTLSVGDGKLTVVGRIERDPNRELGLGGFAPTVILNQADIPKLNVIAAGSRIDYRLLLAGPPEAVWHFQTQQQTLPAGVKLRDAESGNRRLLEPLKRLDQFTQLANVITLLLCGLAIAYTANRLAQRLTPNLALLRSLGASKRTLWATLLLNLLLLWILASLLGALLGGLASWGLLGLLRQLLPALELSFSVPVLLRQSLPAGLWTAALTLLAFSLPALMQLLGTPPIRILRQDGALIQSQQSILSRLGQGAQRGLPTLLLMFVLLVILGLPAQTATVAVVAVLLAALIAWLGLTAFLNTLGQLRQRTLGNLDTGSLLRTPARSAVQLWSLALGLSLMAALWLIRGDLLQRWQNELPTGTANQFAFGLPPDQRDAFAQTLKAKQWPASDLFPMVKARMSALNGQPFPARLQQDFLIQRELNLSMASRLPDNNVITEGRPFARPYELSVEHETAQRLGLKLGDRLTVNLPTGPLTANIVNIRQVKWDSFTPNFFFIYSPGSLDPDSGSYLTSFYVPSQDRQALAQVVHQFPTTLLIDIQAILDEVRRMLQLIGQALGLLGWLSALAGVLVLIATLDASLDQKRREAAILRTLGLSQRALRLRLLQQLFVLGASAGFLAAILAEALVWYLAGRLELNPRWHSQLIALPLGLGLLAMLIGWLRLRTIWHLPARQILKQ